MASHLLQETLPKHQVEPGTLTVHNDRGTEFVADDVTRLFETLDVTRSFSRPRTSNDNAFSESQFKTTKYHPDYPGTFSGFEPAWAYFESFFEWYNTQHRHSGDAAYAVNPERFVNGPPRIRPLPKKVWINAPIDGGSDAPRH